MPDTTDPNQLLDETLGELYDFGVDGQPFVVARDIAKEAILANFLPKQKVVEAIGEYEDEQDEYAPYRNNLRDHVKRMLDL